jgi:hypothetical protein
MGRPLRTGEAAFLLGLRQLQEPAFAIWGVACRNARQERTLEISCSLSEVERFFEKDRNLIADPLF